jgi:hypothetical protein
MAWPMQRGSGGNLLHRPLAGVTGGNLGPAFAQLIGTLETAQLRLSALDELGLKALLRNRHNDATRFRCRPSVTERLKALVSLY